ncbi:VOC family protein [Phenylobacterium sp.]|uniref:VOC family protein n=1 Tax=Phenylobacterium sp. TaxID=1871053 RepID=UPI0027335024|nr:VOC family protein [Phenylobacterium sp.]MDP3853597.1 VOC family protein [Phenylobacterium sp.]
MRGSIHHLDLTVQDPWASRNFYASVLGFLGYRLVDDHPRGFDLDLKTPEGFCSVGIVKAHDLDRPHDRYSPGLHHVAWTAESRDDVDALHALLLEIGAEILDAPADYPRYGDPYYAVFFADPDGLKLEFVYSPRAIDGSAS